jgi:hypothetical protein
MRRRKFSQILGAATIGPIALTATASVASAWTFTADIAECCSCDIPCPCNFGLPTSMRCDGNRLIEIEQGTLDGADLTGIRFLVTFEMGEWARIYADESLSTSQRRTFEMLLPLAFGHFHRQSRSLEYVPMTVTRSPELLSFSSPASQVTMKPLPGLEGEPIAIKGLPSNAFHDYVQYESVRHTHKSANREWSHSGTNGFTSKMISHQRQNG